MKKRLPIYLFAFMLLTSTASYGYLNTLRSCTISQSDVQEEIVEGPNTREDKLSMPDLIVLIKIVDAIRRTIQLQ